MREGQSEDYDVELYEHIISSRMPEKIVLKHKEYIQQHPEMIVELISNGGAELLQALANADFELKADDDISRECMEILKDLKKAMEGKVGEESVVTKEDQLTQLDEGDPQVFISSLNLAIKGNKVRKIYELVSDLSIKDIVKFIVEHPETADVFFKKRNLIERRQAGALYRDFRSEMTKNPVLLDYINNDDIYDLNLLQKIIQGDLSPKITEAAKAAHNRRIPKVDLKVLSDAFENNPSGDLKKSSYEKIKNIPSDEIIEFIKEYPEHASVFLKKRLLGRRDFRQEIAKNEEFIRYITEEGYFGNLEISPRFRALLDKVLEANLSGQIGMAAKDRAALLNSAMSQNMETEFVEFGLFGNQDKPAEVNAVKGGIKQAVRTQEERANENILLDLGKSNIDKDPYDKWDNRMKVKDIPIQDIVKFMCDYPQYAAPFLENRSEKKGQAHARNFRQEILLEPKLINQLRDIPVLKDLLEKAEVVKQATAIKILGEIKDEALGKKLIDKYKQSVAINFPTPKQEVVQKFMHYLNYPEGNYNNYLQMLTRQEKETPGVMRLFNITRKEFNQANSAVENSILQKFIKPLSRR